MPSLPLSFCRYQAAVAVVSIIATMAEGQMTPATLPDPPKPTSPRSTYIYAFQKPAISARVLVGTNGRARDLIILSAPHEDYVEPAEAALRRARFSPATLDGTPVSAYVNVDLRFWQAPPYFDMTAAEQVDQRVILLQGNESWQFSLTGVQDLREPPQLVEAGEPVIPVDENGQPVGGTAKIEFYIAQDGTVRLPTALAADSEPVRLAALAMIADYRFTKPQPRQGRANTTVTKVVMPLSFATPLQEDDNDS